ncbi:MAG: TVP38/TMEM64 family protein [Gammaproteobacteria bacterium]
MAKKIGYKWLKRWIPLVLLMGSFFLFFYFRLDKYISFESLKNNRQLLLRWTNEHYFLTASIYILIYVVGVAISIPGAVFFTLVGGFLFGILLGTLYVVMSATIGATILFMAVKMALADWVAKKSGKWVKQMEKGFQENAFNYLLTLRLIPIFPFWLVNIIPALLGVRLITFVSATFLGIIPGAFIYTSVGNSLGSLFDSNQTPNLNIIMQPNIFLPLLGLAVLSVLPVIYKRFKRNPK